MHLFNSDCLITAALRLLIKLFLYGWVYKDILSNMRTYTYQILAEKRDASLKAMTYNVYAQIKQADLSFLLRANLMRKMKTLWRYGHVQVAKY